MTYFAPLRDRLSTLQLQMLFTLAEQPEGGALDAGLIGLVANIQSVLVAIEEMTEAERPPTNQAPGRVGCPGG